MLQQKMNILTRCLSLPSKNISPDCIIIYSYYVSIEQNNLCASIAQRFSYAESEVKVRDGGI